MTVYIGLDGGGTHTTAVAVRADGTILARAEGGGLNEHIDGRAVCLERMGRLVAELTGRLAGESARVCAGLASLDGPAPSDMLAAYQAALPGGCRLDLQSDVYIALMAHTRGRPGMMIICGTGSMLVSLDGEGRQRAAGGWGWKLRDPGSGYAIARAGVLRALEAWENEGRETPLVERAKEYFAVQTARALVERIYGSDWGAERLAGFGAKVIALADQGDAEALGILTEEMDALARQAAGLRRLSHGVEEAGLYGGVFQHSALARAVFQEKLEEKTPGVKARLCDSAPPFGAVIHMMIRDGLSPEDIPEFRGGKA